MNENSFDIPVLYQGQELQFNAELLQFGYVHKILVNVNGQQVSLEKDDEENYRAVIVDIETGNKIDKGLIKATIESVEDLLK